MQKAAREKMKGARKNFEWAIGKRKSKF